MHTRSNTVVPKNDPPNIRRASGSASCGMVGRYACYNEHDSYPQYLILK